MGETYASLVGRHGGNKTKAAESVGIPRTTFRRKLKQTPNDPVIQSIMDHEGTGLIPSNVWKRGVDADGNRYTVHLKPDRTEQQNEDLAEALKDGLRNCPKAKPVKAGSNLIDGKTVIYPLADLHVGMLADAEEVGQDWDGKIALGVFEKTFSKILQMTPNSAEAVIAQLGDLMHVNDQSNATPASKHQLDADSRFFMILRRAVALMKYAIDAALKKHGKVIYRGCRGNHDPESHHAVTLALHEHYKDEPRVEIVLSANEFYVYEYGSNMVVLCHGDKTTPERLSMFAAQEYAEIWGRTKYRRALTGHFHHKKAQQAGGLLYETIETIIPRDAYSYSHGFSGLRALIALVLDGEHGEVARFRVAA